MAGSWLKRSLGENAEVAGGEELLERDGIALILLARLDSHIGLMGALKESGEADIKIQV